MYTLICEFIYISSISGKTVVQRSILHLLALITVKEKSCTVLWPAPESNQMVCVCVFVVLQWLYVILLTVALQQPGQAECM